MSKTIPMLFNSDMVLALLQGRKTQTRRPVKPQPTSEHSWRGWIMESSNRKYEGCASWEISRLNNYIYAKPPCAVGDLIYVRETHHTSHAGKTIYRADFDVNPFGEECGDDCSMFGEKWIPSIHMPRNASRITLKVTGVRVERIKDISRTDALAEGIDRWDDTFSITPYRNYLTSASLHFSIPECSFISLWGATYGAKSVDENCWVWVIEFEVIKQNVDAYLLENKE